MQDLECENDTDNESGYSTHFGTVSLTLVEQKTNTRLL